MSKRILRHLPQCQRMYDMLEVEANIRKLGKCSCGQPAKSFLTFGHPDHNDDDETKPFCTPCADHIENNGMSLKEALELNQLETS